MCLGYESIRVSESLMAWRVTPPLANIVKRLREILKPGNKAKGKGGDLSIQYHTGALSNKPTQEYVIFQENIPMFDFVINLLISTQTH